MLLNTSMAGGAFERSSLTSSLGRLQQEGLVEILPAAGVRVAVLNLAEAAELAEWRRYRYPPTTTRAPTT